MDMKLTDKQRKFVESKAAGMKNTDAAIMAGYSARTANVQAAQLMKRDDIQAAIAQHQTTGEASIILPATDDPLAFLRSAMNNEMLPVPTRIEAAKSILPYVHGRIGEIGKKQAKTDAANKAVEGRGKFAPKSPPQLFLATKN